MFEEVAILVEAARADRNPRQFKSAVQTFLRAPGLDAGNILFAYNRLHAASDRSEGVLGSAYWLFAMAVRQNPSPDLVKGIPLDAPKTYGEFLMREQQKKRLLRELYEIRIAVPRHEVPGHKRRNNLPL